MEECNGKTKNWKSYSYLGERDMAFVKLRERYSLCVLLLKLLCTVFGNETNYCLGKQKKGINEVSII
jgi:hypothetical protein